MNHPKRTKYSRMSLGVKPALCAKEYFGSESPSAKPLGFKKSHILTVYLTNLFSHLIGGGVAGSS
jgi:hypothetical protein